MEVNCGSDSESTSSSTNNSSEESGDDYPHPAKSNNRDSTCARCGRGPFKRIKRHLLYCRGEEKSYQCVLCKKAFNSQKNLDDHHMPLYSCGVCLQVFPKESLCKGHQCHQKSVSLLTLFCSDSMPKCCQICKSFFTCEKALTAHFLRVHSSVVSAKVVKKGSMGGCDTKVPSTVSVSGILEWAENKNLRIVQNSRGVGPRSLPSAPSSSAVFTTGQASQPLFNFPYTCANAMMSSAHGPPYDFSSSTFPTIMGFFSSKSQDETLTTPRFRRAHSKPCCRQCGIIVRRASLIISHRYLHRGRRSHWCQCGRAFQKRLYLLRHWVQQAEAVSYICVGCGDTFAGASHLAKHVSLHRHTKKQRVKQKCKSPFTCYCGLLFQRPSAYMWHQLMNRTKKAKRCL